MKRNIGKEKFLGQDGISRSRLSALLRGACLTSWEKEIAKGPDSSSSARAGKRGDGPIARGERIANLRRALGLDAPVPNMGSASAQLAISSSAVTPPHGVSHPRPGHSLLLRRMRMAGKSGSWAGSCRGGVFFQRTFRVFSSYVASLNNTMSRCHRRNAGRFPVRSGSLEHV
jgi:hypothetical protein